VRLLLDENFHGDVLRGLLRAYPALDYIRVQDVPQIYGKSDDDVLAWAAQEDRILLSHDYRTIPKAAYSRIMSSQPMPGVIMCPDTTPVGETIEYLVTLIGASDPVEYVNRVLYLGSD
jgi:predicted nuclease of predicted toxin-antitoxin system